jgi:hypothetical protein
MTKRCADCGVDLSDTHPIEIPPVHYPAKKIYLCRALRECRERRIMAQGREGLIGYYAGPGQTLEFSL